ncbi:MAG: nucleoside monophosphate kinase [bacterium]
MDTQTIVFFGIIGSGKGTQIERLMKYFQQMDSYKEPVYAGTGEEFRKLVKSEGFLAERVRETMVKGELQPDFLTTSLFTNVLTNNLNDDKHLITDGFPRTVHQSESFDSMMKFFKRENIKIIHIDISEDEVVKRNTLRGRVDDTPEGIERRIQEYKDNVVPSMEYFRNKEGYQIFKINGEQAMDRVFEDIINVLEL